MPNSKIDLSISALQYVEGIQSGSFTAEEFVSSTLEHIKKHDEKLHAYLDLNQTSTQQARVIDKKIKSGSKDIGACYGMPISVKDNICIRDTRTTCASKILDTYVAPYNATVITKLQKQDAIFLGKTNLDEFAMGLTTEFSAYGPSRNPWNTDYVPGGSSGGSAVAVASHMCIASLGSDTGGSVRNPASFCGVVGFKPTYGLVSRYGLISYANSIEQIGPLTKTVQDTAFLLNIISGVDTHDNTTASTASVTGTDYLDGIDAGIEGKTFAVIKEMINDNGTDPRVAASTKKAVSNLEKLGAQCTEVSLDAVDYSVAAYYTITSTEAASNLARYDNIRYGFDFPVQEYEFNSYISKARSRFGPEVTRRMILGGFVPSAGQAGKYFLKALKVKNKLCKELDAALDSYDFMLAPTVPILPFKLGEKIDDPVALFLIDINTVTANLTGKPAISVPFDNVDGLPVGMQILGDTLQDKAVLQAGYSLQNTVRNDLPEVALA